MTSLKATLAREINKTDITEAETLVFEGRVLSQSGKQTMEPGEFYFRPTAVPITTKPGFWARLFGAKPKQTMKLVQTIVMACPYCSTPLMDELPELHHGCHGERPVRHELQHRRRAGAFVIRERRNNDREPKLGAGCTGGNFVQTISATGTITCAIPSGAFTTTTINHTATLAFILQGDGSTVTSTTSGATTTYSVIPGVYLTPASGTSLFYPLAGNPSGFTTTTVQAALNALSVSGCATYSTI